MNTRTLIRLAAILAIKYSSAKPIPLSQVRLDRTGLREESFEWLRKHHSTGHVEIAETPDGMFVQDGRHRILLALEKGMETLPIKLRRYDQEMNTLSLEDRFLDLLR